MHQIADMVFSIMNMENSFAKNCGKKISQKQLFFSNNKRAARR